LTKKQQADKRDPMDDPPLPPAVKILGPLHAGFRQSRAHGISSGIGSPSRMRCENKGS
jgi:hypothetical protein